MCAYINTHTDTHTIDTHAHTHQRYLSIIYLPGNRLSARLCVCTVGILYLRCTRTHPQTDDPHHTTPQRSLSHHHRHRRRRHRHTHTSVCVCGCGSSSSEQQQQERAQHALLAYAQPTKLIITIPACCQQQQQQQQREAEQQASTAALLSLSIHPSLYRSLSISI